MTTQLQNLKKYLTTKHSNDSEHVTAIFSDEKKLIIEAPAGSGKTKILISKIAFNLASGKVPNYKKILALTFSVNAAYKIKKDIAINLPILTAGFNNNPSLLNNKITVTNFHGFARRVLKKYGYLLNSNLKKIDLLESVADQTMEELGQLNLGLSEPQLQWITDLNKDIVFNKKSFSNNYDSFAKYLDLVAEYFLPKNKIPFNAYLVYLLELFKVYPNLKEFYVKLYPIIIVDEFQDTNCLSWELIKSITTENTKLWLLGDPLQRIYGFIGAIENLMDIAKSEFLMKSIELHTNYRFKNKPDLLRLDKNIRECAKNVSNPMPMVDASILTYQFDTIEEEDDWTIKYIQNFLNENSEESLAI